ncbi:MAG: hypothetical protein M3Y58_22990 [Chloroflexota bacterium]|nr:hypothetical protein [Chloroflexota bacterium]
MFPPPTLLPRHALIVALKSAVVALLLLGVVFVVTPAFPLLAMVGILWLPTD